MRYAVKSFVAGLYMFALLFPLLSLANDNPPCPPGNNSPNCYTETSSLEECRANPLLCNFDKIGDETNLGGLNRVEYLSWSGYTVYEGGPPAYAARIINVLMQVLGLLALATVIYGGFLWMTAQGNEETISKAKDILLGTVIGVLLILFGYSILSEIFTAIAGVARI